MAPSMTPSTTAWHLMAAGEKGWQQHLSSVSAASQQHLSRHPETTPEASQQHLSSISAAPRSHRYLVITEGKEWGGGAGGVESGGSVGVMLGAIIYLTCFSTVMDEGGSWTVGVERFDEEVMLGAIIHVTCWDVGCGKV